MLSLWQYVLPEEEEGATGMCEKLWGGNPPLCEGRDSMIMVRRREE